MTKTGLWAIGLTVLSCAVSVYAADPARAKPGEKAVYMVLMPNTGTAHVSEMPSMAACREAIEFVEHAECLEAVKPLSGELPAAIRSLIPPPGPAQDLR
ncbi:MAG: hypothetical protein RIB59_02520 [Rhodospirillales bacterium]